MHADHTKGLPERWGGGGKGKGRGGGRKGGGPIFTSFVTAKLLCEKFGVCKCWVVPLSLDTPTILKADDGFFFCFIFFVLFYLFH